MTTVAADVFYCPRAFENGGGPQSPFRPPMNGEAHYRIEDQCCTYCGSLDPALFMARLEAGDVRLTPTDKSYKVYIENDGGTPFRQHYRDCPIDGPRCPGPDECSHWTTREVNQTKFYFQHLSEPQQQRFVELLNAGRMSLSFPGHFYVLPFFCRPGSR